MLNENLSFQFNENTVEPVVFKIQLSLASQALHTEALKRAGKYLVAESSLLEIIMKIDQERLFEEFGETHLTPYCIKHLGLSEPVAANFVRVARKSLQVPELKNAIDEGRITLSDAKAIASVITPENQLEWINKAEELSKNKLEMEVAKASPKSSRPEKAKPQGENRIRVEFELTEEEMMLFRRAQDLVSQSLGKSASFSETQKVLLEVFLDKQDPVRKAQRAKESGDKKAARAKVRSDKKTEKAENHTSKKNEMTKNHADKKAEFKKESSNQKQEPQKESHRPQEHSLNKSKRKSSAKLLKQSTRKPLPAEVIHAVNLRDQGHCQARLADGSRCEKSRWTHLHHIVPVAKGGLDIPDNLITLCSSHHRIWHLKAN